MPIRRPRGWELPESAAAPHEVWLNRRAILASLAAGTTLAALPGGHALADEEPDPSAGLYPAPRNEAFAVEGRPITSEEMVTTYNNFYEFGSHKQIWKAAQALPIRPWTVQFDGLVEEERTYDIDELLRLVTLEERVYRLRCVEAWSIVVPWTGFPMRALLDLARPLGSAKYVVMQTFQDPEVAPGQKQFWYPWPYTEALEIGEAANELAFMATGCYGKPLPEQNGSPLRLAVPWKYGFKSIKSIVRFTFAEEAPPTFWETVGPEEYGFFANVNPDVPHPRWSQATERDLGQGAERIATRKYNGYGEWVAELYAGREGPWLFR